MTNALCYILSDVTVQDLREAKLHVFTGLDCQLNTVPLEQEVDTNITYCAGYKFGVISGCQVIRTGSGYKYNILFWIQVWV